MARHVYSVLCKRAIVDQATNVVSLVDLLEGIEVFPEPRDSPADPAAGRSLAKTSKKPKAPTIDLGAVLVTTWARTKLDQREASSFARTLVIAPSGKKIGQSPEQSVDLESFENFRAFLNLPRLPLVGEGRYELAVQLRASSRTWRTITRVPLTVRIRPPMSVAEPAASDLEGPPTPAS